jgi:hypothetical protein
MMRASCIFFLLLNGCSAIGLGVGSQVPRFEEIKTATRGDAVRVEFANGDVLRGAAVEVDANAITILDDDNHDHVIEKKRIVEIERRRGSQWMPTFIAGAIVDGVIIVSIIVAAALGAFPLR